MSRKIEYYKTSNIIKFNHSINCKVKKLYKQERDWTCSLACIRTILSGLGKKIETEDFYINKYNMKPGPCFSKDIKKLELLEGYDVIYGCDVKNTTFDTILNLAKDGYNIMLEGYFLFCS